MRRVQVVDHPLVRHKLSILRDRTTPHGEFRRLAVGGAAHGSPGTAAAELERGTTPELTDRETEVLRLVAKGLTYPQIASRLTLSPRTVQNHVQNTLRKLQLHNKAQLVRYALEKGVG